jgi:N-methylhydantoinase A
LRVRREELRVRFVVGVDIGGTCTDCVVVDETGHLTVAKAFSTPSDFSKGILDSLQVAAESLNTTVEFLLAKTNLFLHSTTVAENAIVDGTLCKAGLLVTRGFENTLYMTRGGYGRWSGLSEDEKKNIIDTDKPETLIPLPMIKGIAERSDVAGDILQDPDDAQIEQALRDLVRNGAEAIGVCFLWAFRNPQNERRVRRIAEKLFPDMFLTLSSDLAPIEGEYERTSTVALNAVLGPIVAAYLSRLMARLQDSGFHGTVLVMQAHGGLLRAQDAPARAVGMIESGPIGGLIGSKALGNRIGIKNILATDMGGTTFKAGVIRDGRIDDEREPRVYRYHYSLNKMDMVSIGLAGGSIIAIDPQTGLPKLGPKSAGSDPGPVCYGFGGHEPTVTDVDLLLGYLNPAFFLGGRSKLDRDLALKVFKAKVADPLRMDPTDAAGSVYRLANSMIYDLLHKQTVEKGLDPREYALFVSGGTAGMHMPAIAQELGVSKIVIPHSASVHGAFGLVSSDVVYTDVTALTVRVPVTASQVNDIFAALTKRVTERLMVAGFKPDGITTERSIYMRYRHQVHVIPAPIDGTGALSESDIEQVCDRFEALYAERYGKEAGYREAGMEMVSFHIRGIAQLQKPELRDLPHAGSDPAAAYVETRDSFFGKIQPARCYDFEKLAVGNAVVGPAIVWTPITTIVIQPGQTAMCDPHKNLTITWEGAGR